MTTNSAGFSGAKPTSMLTMPRLRSFWVVFVGPLPSGVQPAYDGLELSF